MEYNFSDRLKNLGGNAIREIFKLLENPEVISFAGGFPTTTALPVEIVGKLASETLNSPDAYGLLQYGGTEGYKPLRNTAIEFIKRYGINNIILDNTLIVSGGQQTIDLTLKAFMNKGDVILVENPTYLAVLHIIKTYEGVAVGLKSGDEGIDLNDLEEKIKAHKPKILYLVPTFSNPTGRTISLEKRKAIADITAKYNVIVLEDDPYSELRFQGDRIPSIKSMDTAGNVIFSTSFSKTVAPALRCGVAVASADIIRKLTIGKQATDVHTSTLSQAIINKYLSYGMMDTRLPELIAIYKEKKDRMIDALVKYMPDKVKYTNPQGGLFIWCELPCNVDTSAMFKDLVETTKVAYVPGKEFFVDGAVTNCLRLNYSNSTLENIDKGIMAMSEYLKKIL